MTENKPSSKPANSNFSSGPCAKRPGWNINLLKNSPVGRSHRSKECKNKLKEAIDKSKKVLKLPDSYSIAIMAGSNTGALESAMWSLLGCKGVDVLAWENFGKDWVIDILDQLKIENVTAHKADYGSLPDLQKVNSGEASVGFSLFATQMEDVISFADKKLTMPPKSTWFDPKPLDGLVAYDFE